MAATPKLEIIAVTPAAKSISVGQKLSFTATGTFSNGSKQALGPAISNIAPGFYATCVLLTSGGVECWGAGNNGQLGDGNTANSLIPRPVTGITTATAVASGLAHSCAILTSGTVMCWGLNSYGQLGNGSTALISSTPVPVTGISTATAVAAGTLHSCAVLGSGAVQCWGANSDGDLGDGSNTNSRIPVSVTGISTATAVAVGMGHSCALLVSGAVQCWGGNYYGELGNGSTTHSYTPVTVSAIGTATAVTIGWGHSCALLASGAVKCWGYNLDGELGDGTNSDSTTPVSVAGIGTAIAIAAGEFHTCAALRGGSVKCWGSNEHAQLGNGTRTASNTPVLVHAINSPTKLAAGGGDCTCSLFSGGAMRCWGDNDAGQLGNRRTARSTVPVSVVGTPGVVWQSSDPSKATITDRGVATGRATGNTTITATTAKFINDNAVLTVK